MMQSPEDRGPEVTVAMSVLNGGRDLAAAVRSIMAQTFTNWELLIIDDGSTDSAVEDLLPWVDGRVRVIRDGLNKGLATRLNEAVSLARGRYFSRMDHDDVSHPQRLEKQLALMRAHQDVDLCGAFCLTMNEQDGLTGVWPAKATHDDICSRPWLALHVAHPTWFGKTSWFRQNPYRVPAPYCSEDQELLLRASLTSRYRNCPEFLLAYRVRSHTPFKKSWKTRWAVLQFQLEHFMHQRQYVNAALASAVTLLRVLKDLRAFLFVARGSSGAQGISPDVALVWQRLLAEYRSES
jgi:glycosyltransferase involved in cell wall biosynthesis